MRGDPPNLCVRLTEQLRDEGRVRDIIHEREAPVTGFALKPLIRTSPAKRITGAGRGGQNRRGIIVDGKEYRTQKEAMRALHVGPHKLADWLDTGRAQYPKVAP